MTAYTFDQIIDFTRTSAATYVANTGFVTQTPASRNLLTYTQEFDNAAWSKVNSTATANVTAAPDGTNTADKLVDTATNSTHYVAPFTGLSLSGGVYTFSAFIKRAELTTANLWFNATTFGIAYFDLVAGTASVTAGAYVDTATITNVGNGWYRCTITSKSLSAGTYFPVIGTGNPASYAGTGNGIFIWGAQLEQASAATAYTRNVGGLYPPRFDYDPVTLAPRGLLIEEQRTNLLTYSEQFDNTTGWPTATNVTVTANSTTSPDGTANADTIDDGTTASVQHRLFRSYTFTAAAHTLSIYAKAGTGAWFQLIVNDGTTSFYANFNASTGATGSRHASATSTITNVGNGWYRCTMTATTLAAVGNVQIGMLDTDQGVAVPSYTGANRTLFFYGAQLEAGAFATSYIPTVASQVTRTADLATVTGANFSRWYNQSEGTLVVEAVSFKPTSVSAAGFAAIASDGTSNERVQIVFDTSQVTAAAFDGGVSQALLTASYTANSVTKAAFAYAANNFAASFNGAAAATDTSGTLPTADRLSLGSNWSASGFYLNGHIRRIKYYPVRLSNAQIQALTV